jgi:hypothetical protein
MDIAMASLVSVLNLWLKIGGCRLRNIQTPEVKFLDDFLITDDKIIIYLTCYKTIECSMKSHL